jgi:hypothetical protein
MDLWLRIAAEGYEFEYVNLALIDRRAEGDASKAQNWDKRYYGNRLLFKEFFLNPKYQKIISYKMRRHAWAALWRKRGSVLCEQGYRFKAFRYGIGSVFYVPFDRMAWGVILKSILPGPLIKLLRKIMILVREG